MPCRDDPELIKMYQTTSGLSSSQVALRPSRVEIWNQPAKRKSWHGWNRAWSNWKSTQTWSRKLFWSAVYPTRWMVLKTTSSGVPKNWLLLFLRRIWKWRVQLRRPICWFWWGERMQWCWGERMQRCWGERKYQRWGLKHHWWRLGQGEV